MTEAVRHFADQGKSPKEIAELTGSTTEAVRGLMQRHRQVRRTTAIDGLTWPQRDKIRRTYLAYLDLMAEGLGSDRDVVHHLCRGVHVNKEPALPPEQKVDEAEPARAGLVDAHMQHSEPEIPSFALSDDECLPATPPSPPKPEPKPMMVMKLDKRPMDLTNASRFYTLRREGMYLNLDGSGFTDVRRHAYRATLPQARKMRLVNAVAMGCSLSPFELSKK